MSKQQAMEAIFAYLTDHSHPKQPAIRSIRVVGDEEGLWRVEFAQADGESREANGADFAEALEAALNAPIC